MVGIDCEGCGSWLHHSESEFHNRTPTYNFTIWVCPYCDTVIFLPKDPRQPFSKEQAFKEMKVELREASKRIRKLANLLRKGGLNVEAGVRV